jgi:hypothetical protein
MTYGYSYPDNELEIVNIRVRATGKMEPIQLPEMDDKKRFNSPEPVNLVRVAFKEGIEEIPLYI